jgi:tRNA dimethylallyltransferase
LLEIQQLRAFFSSQIQDGHVVDETRGIWVAIGYKEFSAYFEAMERGDCASHLARLKAEAISRTKIATGQYAKRQEQWIRGKLVPTFQAAKREGNLFLLDGSKLEDWSSLVEQTASRLTCDFLEGSTLPDPASVSGAASQVLQQIKTPRQRALRTIYCEACNTTVSSDQQWQQHLKSKKHKKVINPKHSRGSRSPANRVLQDEPISPLQITEPRGAPRNDED